MKMLARDLSIRVPGGKRDLLFSEARDVRDWLNSESEYWGALDQKSITDRTLRNYWNVQTSFINSINGALTNLEQASEDITEQERGVLTARLEQAFSQLQNGEVICKDSPYFPFISDLWQQSPDAAALILMASRNDATGLFGNFGQGISFLSLIKVILGIKSGKDSDGWLKPQREEVASLKRQLEESRDSVREEVKRLSELSGSHANAEAVAASVREKAWGEQVEKVESDWKRLIKTYDEAMAMAAPSTYWRKRADTHKKQAISFGASFAFVLCCGLVLFALLGLPYLAGRANAQGGSVVLALVPVLVPAFGAIWVLKMLGRLLSESLYMMRDAKERETMVQTFLAFVHDEQRGKSLLLEQDRILILHALFRPSSVSSVDDSPPVHWFDILSTKMSDKAKSA